MRRVDCYYENAWLIASKIKSVGDLHTVEEIFGQYINNEERLLRQQMLIGKRDKVIKKAKKSLNID